MNTSLARIAIRTARRNNYGKVILLAIMASLLFQLPTAVHATRGNLLTDTDFADNAVGPLDFGKRFLGERWYCNGSQFLTVSVEPATNYANGCCLHLAGTKTGSAEEAQAFSANQRKDNVHGSVWIGYPFEEPEPNTTYTFSLRGHGKGAFTIGMVPFKSGLMYGYNAANSISEPFALTDKDQTYSMSFRTPDDPRLEGVRITIRPQTAEFDGYLGDFRLAITDGPETGPAIIEPLPYKLDRSQFPVFAWKISDPDEIAEKRFVLSTNRRKYTADAPELSWDGQILRFRPDWPEARFAITLKVYDRNGNLYTRKDIITLERELAAGNVRDKSLPDLHIADPIRVMTKRLQGDADWRIITQGAGGPLLQSVSIAGACSAPHVWSDANGDFTSARTLAASIIRAAGAKTDREKAIACWHWTEEHMYEGVTGGGSFLQHVNGYGGGCCGDFTTVLTPLLVAAGLKSAAVSAPGHVITTTWWGGKPHHFDGVERLWYPTRDGTDIASLEDIKADPRLLYRNVLGDGTAPWAHNDIRPLIHIYFCDMNFPAVNRPRLMEPDDPEVTERIAYDLRDGESFTLLGSNDGIWTRNYVGEPPDYTNGLFSYTPDFTKSSWQTVMPAENLQAGPAGLSPKTPGKATLSYERKSSYNIASAVIWGTFTRRSPLDSVELYLSRDPMAGKERVWQRVWRMEDTGTVPVSIDLRPYLTFKAMGPDSGNTVYGYQLRFMINTTRAEDVVLRDLKILTYTQHTAVSTPRLAPGENIVHFNRDAQTGPVTVTWTWREAGGFTISNSDPVEGEQCTLTAKVTNRGSATARNVTVRFMGGNNPQQSQVLGERVIPQLSPGKTASVSIPWVAIPYQSPASTSVKPLPSARDEHLSDQNEHAYDRLWVRVDPEGNIPENDKYDNEAILHVQVREKPDLVISPEFIQLTPVGARPAQAVVQNSYTDGQEDGPIKDVAVSFAGPQPERVRVRAIVRNHCQTINWLYVHGSPARNIVVRFYDGDPKAGGQQIGADQTIPMIAPIEHDWAEVEWPTATLTGLHRIFVIVDPDNAVAESDETPASNSAAVTVQFGQAAQTTATVKNGTALTTVPAGNQPWGIAVNPTTNRVYMANWGNNTVSVIDGNANTLLATVPVGNHPWAIAVNPATNRVYVTNYRADSVSVLDGNTNTVIATVPVERTPNGLAVNSITNLVYVSNGGSATVSVLDGSTNKVLTAVPVREAWYQIFGVAVNPTTNRIYVAYGAANAVGVIDGNTNTFLTTIKVRNPFGVAVNPTSNRIYAANDGANTVSVIDGNTNAVLATVPVGIMPYGIAVNPTTNRIYVTNSGGNTVSVLDGNTNTVLKTVSVGKLPEGVAVNPTTNRVYVANEGDDMVSVLQGFDDK